MSWEIDPGEPISNTGWSKFYKERHESKYSRSSYGSIIRETGLLNFGIAF